MAEQNFKVYKSSAGSGKTFTLVKEFLRHCLSSADGFEFSRILAITFTNKATFEMKARILSALKELGKEGSEESTLAKLLAKETQLSSQAIAHKSQYILRTILHHYADFGISTIDKFTHRVIRTFTKDLNLSPIFKVELDEESLLSEVIDQLISQVGKDENITQLILRFTLARMEEEKQWKINQELVRFAMDTMQEKAMPFLSEMRDLKAIDYQESIRIYQNEIAGIKNKIKQLASDAVKQISQANIEDASFSGRATLSKYFKKLLDGNPAFLKPSNQLAKNMEEDNWFSSKCNSSQKVAIEKIKPQLKLAYDELQKVVEEDYPYYLSMQEVLKSVHQLSLLNEIEKKLANFKKEEQVLNISDFNRIIAQVVINEPIPFIYERLGERYKSIMIDEFQDTSVLQFTNLLPLIEDSLSRGRDSLLVGDAKQAIYRFRGGEVEQFSDMPYYEPSLFENKEQYNERMSSLRPHYQKEVLNYNYRSSPILVDFNNAFFEYIKTLPNVSQKISQIFDSHQQLVPEGKAGGYVEISFIEGLGTEEKEVAYHEKAHQSITDCLADGYKLSDLAILFTKKSQAAAMASYLKAENIDVISSEALLLKNDLQVNFLVNFATWITYPDNHLVQKELVEFFYQKKQLHSSIEDTLQTYVGKPSSLRKLFPLLGFEFSVEAMKLKAPFEFFEECIRLFQLGEKYSVYLQTFQDQVLDYSMSVKGSIAQFLEWWSEKSDHISLDVPEGLNAVTLMTVHKSKGLEFPVVIFPYANFAIRHSSAFVNKHIWAEIPKRPTIPLPFTLVEFRKALKESTFHKEYAVEYEKAQIDVINAAYVALTRASERMYIHTEKPRDTKTERLFNLPDLLYAFAQLSFFNTGENEIYIKGEPRRKKYADTAAQEKQEKEIVMDSYLSNSWENKLQISYTHKNSWHKSDELAYGILLHEIVGEVNLLKELDGVLENFQLRGRISASEKLQLEKKLKSLLAKESILPFFEGDIRVKNEATIISDSGKLLRPDRVVFSDDTVTVLDYKTGEQNESHYEQVKEYVQAIAKVTTKRVEGYVLYTEEEHLVRV